MAGDFLTFIDDCRLIGFSIQHCHEVHRQFTGRVQFLGIDIRIGEILKAWHHANSDKLYCEKVDVGEHTLFTV